MKRLIFCFSGLLLIFFLSETANGQSFYNKRQRNNIATVGLGTTSYFGDLNNPGDVIDTKLNVSVGIQHIFSQRFNVRGELSWFQLQGRDIDADDDGRIERNLSFTSSNIELNVVGLVNLLPSGPRFYQRRRLNFYGFAGVGLLYFNPKGELDGTKYALQPLRTEGVEYSRTTFVIPYGGGVKIKVDPFINVAMEVGMRKTFTDYIDDVSTRYLDNASFTDDIARRLADRRPEVGLPLKEAGSKRGNPGDDDGYMMITLKVEYYLPSGFFAKQQKSRRNPKRYRRAKRR